MSDDTARRPELACDRLGNDRALESIERSAGVKFHPLARRLSSRSTSQLRGMVAVTRIPQRSESRATAPGRGPLRQAQGGGHVIVLAWS
jgi:hypothetical protein